MDQEEKLAYMSGLMDGDGSFTLARRTNKKGINLLYYPLIQMGSLKKDTLEIIQKKFGGRIHLKKSHLKKDGSLRRDFYRWRIEKSAFCIPFLEKIIPSLEIKKDRAQFLLDFIKRNPFKRGVVLEKDILLSRQSDYIKMKEFNDERSFKRPLIKQSKKFTDDNLFWAYFAGLLDTDGSFSIKKETGRRYTGQILLSMTDIRGINKIRKNCPCGTVFLVNAETTKLGACYRYGIYRREEIINILPKIIPFLTNKKNQAEMLLNFCENQKIILHRRAGMPKEELIFRETCYQHMMHLNKYGVLKPTLIDLEARQGDRAEGESHGERLSEMATKVDAIV